MNTAIRRVGYAITVLIIVLVGQITYLQVVDANHLANDPNNIRRFLRDINRPRGEILTADDQVVARSIDTGGEIRYQRVYPQADLFAQISGYQSVLDGNTGVEASYNAALTGRDTEFKFENIVQGKPNTGNVVLAQSLPAQTAARDALQGQKGSVVAIDPRTGAILAMYSNPSFDPNPLTNHDTAKANLAFFLLNNDTAKPALARSYRERFPPGSTFKVVTTAAALDTGIATPDTTFPYSARFPLPGTTTGIGNFGGGSCGGGTLVQSFLESCNVTFAKLGYDLGPNFVPTMNNCGVGSATAPIAPPLDLDPGAAGSIGPAADAEPPRFALAGIGQGDVFVTPLEMALVAAGIANGGVIMQPHVAQSVTDSDGKVVDEIKPHEWKRCMTPATASALTDMMVKNVEGGTGTRAQINGVAVAGKTGTAQNELGAPHAWFIAFAPADNPRVAVSVLVENGGIVGDAATGGDLAAPIAKQVLEALLNQ
ncbi:MAG TPA: penicillin-binding transpeptidase domain-containing protein [Acidimicrobiia bacterium]|nr:penicillin-binding transpeptidase domain-containing protein [Acidimicrobiia bacterium]